MSELTKETKDEILIHLNEIIDVSHVLGQCPMCKATRFIIERFFNFRERANELFLYLDHEKTFALLKDIRDSDLGKEKK